MKIIHSPLEQFEILPVIPSRFGPIDLSFSIDYIIGLVLIFFILTYIAALRNYRHPRRSLYLIPGRFEAVIYLIQKLVMNLLTGNVNNKKAELFFPVLFMLFVTILSMNLIGLVPYSFTITSNIIVTFFISLSVFIGINIVCYKEHGIHFFSLFLPPGTSFALAFLLVPIEIISYVFKPISLSIRLFANMMAGHTLLKVIAGFAFSLMAASGFTFLISYIPLLILVPLYGLELAVAFIQTFVFSILITIYLNDALNLH